MFSMYFLYNVAKYGPYVTFITSICTCFCIHSLLLNHIVCTQCIDLVYCYRCSMVSVYVCVCLLGITMNCSKTAEPVKMPFGFWTLVGPPNHVLGGGRGLDTPGKWAVLGHLPACCEL